MKCYTNNLKTKFEVIILVFALLFSPLNSMLPTYAQESEEEVTEETTSEDTTTETVVEPEEATSEVDDEVIEKISEELSEEEPQDTELITGDIDIGTQVTTNTNTNENEDSDNSTTTEDLLPDQTGTATSTDDGNTNSDVTEVTATSTENILDDEVFDSATSTSQHGSSTCSTGCSSETNTNINDESEGTVDNSVEINGTSGDNEASNDDGNVSIDTGEINLLTQIINFVNSNIIGAGFNVILNIMDGFNGNLDLSNITSDTYDGSLNLTTNNSATTTNALTVNAKSGDNSGKSGAGSVEINTGDINISTNVVNVVNSNIVNSQFMITVINIWNDWAGDIILPSQRLDISLSEVPETQNVNLVDNDNDATVANHLDIDGSTGDNIATSTTEIAEVKTGSVNIDNQVVNQVNTNLVNEVWLNTTVNIFGEWFGYVLGLDELADYTETDYQVVIEISNKTDDLPDHTSYLSITNVNDADVTNDINIDASTGTNTAESETGTVEINTGDITSLANIFNIVNTNIVGGQWILALINVFGEWNGDLVYGRPDLMIKETVGKPNKISAPADQIEILFEYANNGDSPAIDVVIIDDFNEDYLYVAKPNGGQVLGNGLIQWTIPEIQPGETGSVSYSIAVDNTMPYGETTLTNNVLIESYDKDRNYNDNYDSGSFTITRIRPTNPYSYTPGLLQYPNFPTYVFHPAFTISKNHHATSSIATTGEEIPYTIEFENTGSGIAYDVMLIDDLIDPEGNNVNSQGWALGKVAVAEKIIVDYTIVLSNNALPGVYTNYAQVVAEHETGFEVVSEVVTSNILIENSAYAVAEIVEQVLGIESDTSEAELVMKSVQSIQEGGNAVKSPYPAFLGTPVHAAESEPNVLGISTGQTFSWSLIPFYILLIITTTFAFCYVCIRRPF